MSQVEFKNLKSEIIKETKDTIDLEKVKNSFSFIIQSRRKLSRIKTLEDVFNLLEERDALDCNNISPLKYLGKILHNINVTNLVRGYEKVYAEQNTCLCGKTCMYLYPMYNPEKENCALNESDELLVAFNNISLNIGNKWRVLSSELCVPECYVDEVREKYPDDMPKQALKILEIWRKVYGEDANLNCLKKTLESRLCKKKGLGLHMLKPLITIE